VIYIAVKNAVDAVIDAKFLNASSSVLKQAAETMNTNLHSFTAGEYSKNIVSWWVFLAYFPCFIMKDRHLVSCLCVYPSQ
jgi:hypothetical protein